MIVCAIYSSNSIRWINLQYVVHYRLQFHNLLVQNNKYPASQVSPDVWHCH